MTLLNLSQIKQYLPHRYPFLFVDSVEELVPNEYIIAKKGVTGNEDFFNGHFPGNPVMPGVLQIEAMGQAGALLAIMSGAKLDEETSIYVTSITDCRFKKPVVPGDMLELRSKVIRQRMGVWKLGCEVRVRGDIASMATVTATSGPKVKQPELPADFRKPIFND
ncbi:MAG: 3-hydroxyacyl-ACP dehydratase FabZ [Deltaproteobacteria bacterium]